MLRLLTLLILAGLALPAAAAARTGPCMVPGTDLQCHVWTADVTTIADGDTIYVDIRRDGTSARFPVRMTGLNAMEQTVYGGSQRQGECHAVEATSRLEELIGKSRGRVRLIAQDPESRSGRRLRRVVAVKIRGRWRDTSRRLIAEGYALWLPNRREHAWNRDYSILAQRAAALGRGLWDADACAPGPSEGVPIRLWANANADGADGDNPNGEWIKIRNLDPLRALPLGGWWVRDSALRRYTFPPLTTLAPGETVTVHVGEGQDMWPDLYWGLPKPAFQNASRSLRAMGDGAYLFDPDGDVRADMMYPCRHACSNPDAGAIAIGAKPRGREHITLRNVAAHAVDLEFYRLTSPPFVYTFSDDSLLAPGEEMRIDVEGDPANDTRLDRHWGETGPILRNRGDRVKLTHFTEQQIACHAYGDRSC